MRKSECVMSLGVPINISSFRGLERGGCCCVSGAKFVSGLLRAGSTRMALVAHPQHFKGALNVHVLTDFFSVQGSDQAVFRKLRVSGGATLYSR